jgi:small redox-active disulfide protein 2
MQAAGNIVCRVPAITTGGEADMDIKVLGSGCAKCKKLYEETEKAVKRLGLAATLTKVENREEIVAQGVLMTPALVINNETKVAGRMPTAAELTSLLTTAAMKEEAH